jgi:hypothetical protein
MGGGAKFGVQSSKCGGGLPEAEAMRGIGIAETVGVRDGVGGSGTFGRVTERIRGNASRSETTLDTSEETQSWQMT